MWSTDVSILSEQVGRTYRQIERRILLVGDLREGSRRFSNYKARLGLDRYEARNRHVVVGDLNRLAAFHVPQMAGQVVLEICHANLLHSHMVAIWWPECQDVVAAAGGGTVR